MSEFKKPFCPNCNTEMQVVRHSTYYEELVFWECECNLEEVFTDESNKSYGRYT